MGNTKKYDTEGDHFLLFTWDFLEDSLNIQSVAVSEVSHLYCTHRMISQIIDAPLADDDDSYVSNLNLV